ncbi:unnamed protein product [Bursaphelenchus xylophilus]|uniref:(pine wood nematode) hypothetical protein n=1 Tax=Bursaphelenchus xylophilus TaxID=6326 RepID=A0A1I7S400_BURXY|nr:unnamed protein product [Bursaphelenchus xylophilus]CAG9116594.1 unnamed protein product [Bursaphelenchus xylophilus]
MKNLSGTMVKLFYLLLISCLMRNVFGKNVFDQLTKKGDTIIKEARTDNMTRECSCDEENFCGTEIKEEVFDCFETCWFSVKSITDHPEQLKQCLKDKAYIIDQIISCLHEKAESCVPGMDGPQIHYIDINKIIKSADAQIHLQADKFTKTLPNSARDLLEAAITVGTCVKECFQEKNQGGFCFDHKGCQPKIETKEMRNALKKCSKELEWQKEAAEMCDCAYKAGVGRVQQYCDMIHAMNRHKPS